MRQHKRRSGAILIDFLFAMMAALLVGASLVILIQCSYTSQSVITNQNMAYTGARKAMDVLTSRLSNAQAYQISNSPVTFSALSAGTISSITCYTNSAGDTDRYWLDTSTTPQTLKRTRTVSGTSTTTVIVNGVQSLYFTYYLTDGVNYTASSWTSYTTTPTAYNLPTVGAIQITATVNINGYQRQLTSFVRLRNSPYRG